MIDDICLMDIAIDKMGPKINYANEFENLNKLSSDIKTDLEGKATTTQLDNLLKEIWAKVKESSCWSLKYQF